MEELKAWLSSQKLGALLAPLQIDGVDEMRMIEELPFSKESMPATWAAVDEWPPAKQMMAKKAFSKKCTDDQKALHEEHLKMQQEEMQQKLEAVKTSREALERFSGSIEDHRRAAVDATENARNEAKRHVVSNLKSIGWQIQPEIDLKLLVHCLDQFTNLGKSHLSQPTCLANNQLLRRNGLFSGMLLESNCARVCRGHMIQLVDWNDPSVLRAPSKTFELHEAEMAKSARLQSRHSMMTEIGASWGVAATTTGAAFVSQVLVSWSIATQWAAAKRMKKLSEREENGSTLSYTKTTSVHRCTSKVSLADASYILDGTLEAALEAMAGMGRTEMRAAARECLKEFGSHFSTEASLGGRFDFGADMQVKHSEVTSANESAIASALTSQISASIAAAGLGFMVGYSAAKTTSSNDTLASSALVEERSVRTDTSSVGGPAATDVPTWLASLEVSNGYWAVTDRAPESVRTLWELVRSKSTLEEGARRNVARTLEEVWVQEIMGQTLAETAEEMEELLRQDMEGLGDSRIKQAQNKALHLLVIGSVGDGKSSLIRNLSDPRQNGALAQDSMAPRGCTKKVRSYIGKPICGRQVYFYDTPGIGDNDVKLAELIALLEAQLLDGHIHGVIATTQVSTMRITLAAQLVKAIVKAGFMGAHKWNSVILCGTQVDRVSPSEMETFEKLHVEEFFADVSAGNSGRYALVHHKDYSMLEREIKKLPEEPIFFRRPEPADLAVIASSILDIPLSEALKQVEEARNQLKEFERRQEALLLIHTLNREDFAVQAKMFHDEVEQAIHDHSMMMKALLMTAATATGAGMGSVLFAAGPVGGGMGMAIGALGGAFVGGWSSTQAIQQTQQRLQDFGRVLGEETSDDSVQKFVDPNKFAAKIWKSIVKTEPHTKESWSRRLQGPDGAKVELADLAGEIAKFAGVDQMLVKSVMLRIALQIVQNVGHDFLTLDLEEPCVAYDTSKKDTNEALTVISLRDTHVTNIKKTTVKLRECCWMLLQSEEQDNFLLDVEVHVWKLSLKEALDSPHCTS